MYLSKFANLAPRKRMGILAIFLGVLAVFADDPYDKSKTSVNTKELSLFSVDEINNITVEDLADAIIKSKIDFRLVDLRKPSEFAKYYIPSSENIQVSELLTSDLQRNDNILLYSDNDFETAQAWFLLKSNNYKGVSVLKGGLKSWKENILFPACVCEPIPTTEQQHKHNKLAEVSKYFGGSLRSDSNVKTKDNMEMPEIEAPTGITLKKAKGKKKREGC